MSGFVDQDPQEVQEWLDALDGVIANEGEAKAEHIIKRLLEKSHDFGLRFSNETITTPYINSIGVGAEARIPDAVELLEKVINPIRWNAMAMIVKANRKEHGLGGHLASFASSAMLYEIGFNYFFKGNDHPDGGDLIFTQGHSSPGMYARAFVEGRLSEEQLTNFRREVDGKGLSSYPHPYLMPDFWQFPTVSMGLGPITAVYTARFAKYLMNRELIPKNDRKIWCFIGDGETDEPETLAALSLARREKLDNLIFVVNCNLQRLDGPVRGNGKILQELEGRFKGNSWNVIKVVWSSGWDDLFARDTEGVLVEKLNSMVDGELQRIVSERAAKGSSSASILREHLFNTDPRLAALVQDKSDYELGQLLRGGHDPRKLYAAYHAAVNHKNQPTVILAHTVKGYGLGEEAEAVNVTHQKKELKNTSLIYYRNRFKIDLTDEEAEALTFVKYKKDSPEEKFMHEKRKNLGGYLPIRIPHEKSLPIPPLSQFDKLLEDVGEKKISTTIAFVRFLNALLKEKSIAKYIVPILSDEARTFGMEGLFRQIGIYSPAGQLYKPQDAESLAFYKEAINGQILQEGINEAGALASWTAAGSAHGNFGIPMIPMFIFYSMFGFQRVGDSIWAAGDSRTRGFLLGATSGRTTLNGEGLQHEDGNSQLVAGTYPTCLSYDPAYGYELVVIMHEGLRRMYVDNEDVFYYLTLTNQNALNPAMPKGAEKGIIKGIYPVNKASTDKNAVQLVGSGAIFHEVLAAADLLKDDFDIKAQVFSATSINELVREGDEAQRWNRLNPTKAVKVPYIRTQLNEKQPVVIATDYVKAHSEQLRKFLPNQNMTVLGTDGYGRSDTREQLRDFFEVSRYWIVVSALYELAQAGKIEPKIVEDAMKKYGLDSSKSNPLYS